MSLFGRKEKEENAKLRRQNKALNSAYNSVKSENKSLRQDNARLNSRVNALVDLCNEKDDIHKATISDALRHGSSSAGREMADRKKYLREQRKK